MLQTFPNRTRATRVARGLARLTLTLALGLSAGAALGDGYLDQANKPANAIPTERRSDLVILPLLAKMDAPPSTLTDLPHTGLMFPGCQNWGDAEKWATGANQKAILDALAKVTKEDDFTKAYVFAQPYGAESVSAEMVRARLYTEVGDPPTLAAAQHLYLPSLDKVALLVNVEATRLTGEGKVNDAIDVLTNWIYFSRQMCDRQFFREASWGLDHIRQGFERIRDVLYMDFRDKKACEVGRLLKQVGRLDCNNGYLDLSRMLFPAGNRLATDQIVERVYIPRDGVDARIFSGTMATLGSTEFPLRLFSEEAKWRDAAASQGNSFDAGDRVKGLYGDWVVRWQTTNWFDRRNQLQPAFEQLDKARFAAISQSTPDMTVLLDQRQIARVEGVGTRLALSHMGVYYTNKAYSNVVTGVRPLWMTRLDADPYNPNIQNGAEPPMGYFVPIRDAQVGPREEPKPHEMEIVPPDNSNTFGVTLRNDVCVIYSVGSDYQNNFAKRIQNTSKRVEGADYLIWPPLPSLYREHLRLIGDLK